MESRSQRNGGDGGGGGRSSGGGKRRNDSGKVWSRQIINPVEAQLDHEIVWWGNKQLFSFPPQAGNYGWLAGWLLEVLAFVGCESSAEGY